jgi:hypothetical protein
VPSAQQYALPLLKQSSQSLPPLWPRRMLAADALLAKSTTPVTNIARGAEGTQLRTRSTMGDPRRRGSKALSSRDLLSLTV